MAPAPRRSLCTAQPGARHGGAVRPPRHVVRVVADADAPSGAAAPPPPPSPPPLPTRRAAMLLAATAAAALPSTAAVQVPDPLFVRPRRSTKSGGAAAAAPAAPLVDALEVDLPLRVVALRGSVPAEALAGFKASLGRRGGGVVLQTKPQLASIFDDLARPEGAGPKSAATADCVSLGDEWLAGAVARGLVAPIPGAAASPWWARLHPTWRRLVTRGPDGRPLDDDGGGRRGRGRGGAPAVFGSPYRWGAYLVAARVDRLRSRRVPPPRAWADLLHPGLAGRVALPASPRLFAGVACAAAGLGFNPSPREVEAALGSGRRGDRAASAAAALGGTMAALRRAALLVSDRDAGRALAAGDAWVAVGASPDLAPLAARSAGVALLAPPEGVPLWADLWAVPSLAAAARGGAPPSPLLPSWLDYCLSAGRADAGRGFGAMAGGASPLVLPPSAGGGGGGGGGGGLFSSSSARRRGPAAVAADAPADGLGPGGLPPASTLARSAFLEPANEIVREALLRAGAEV